MYALGIAVGYPATGRPVVACVILRDGSTPAVVQAFDLKTSATELVDQVVDLAKSLGSKLSGVTVDAAVIRRANRPAVANRRATPHKRLLIEGALLLTCRDTIRNVEVRDGKEIGAALGTDNADGLASGASLDPTRAEAASAALCALRAPT